jgi:hypothetical protein
VEPMVLPTIFKQNFNPVNGPEADIVVVNNISANSTNPA